MDRGNGGVPHWDALSAGDDATQDFGLNLFYDFKLSIERGLMSSGRKVRVRKLSISQGRVNCFNYSVVRNACSP
jgi:hypothetical protein